MGKSRNKIKFPKEKDYANKENKIHRISTESRTNIKQSLKKVLRGEITEDEFEEAYGENEEV